MRRVWSDVIEGLQKSGWRVIVAVLHRERGEEWRLAYPEVQVETSSKTIAFRPMSTNGWGKVWYMAGRFRSQLKHVSWLVQLARRSDARTLIVQSPPESVLAAIVSRLVGGRSFWVVPNVIGETVPLGLNRLAYRLVFLFGGMVPIAGSRYTDATLGKGRFTRHVVHPGVDVDYYQPGTDGEPMRQALGIPSGSPVIGVFARMEEGKGQIRLVEAMQRTKVPFHAILCGGASKSEYADLLHARVKNLGLEDRVHIQGPREDLRPYYAAVDLIGNFYDGAEGFGLTLVEAMSCGKPVLAHSRGGPSEIVTDGETGWLLPSASAESISQGLERAYSDRKAWQRMGAASRVRAVSEFSQEKFVKSIVGILEGSRSNPPRPVD